MTLKHTTQNKTQTSVFFIILMGIPMLFFDSIYFYKHYFEGQNITSFLVVSITLYLLHIGSLRLKLLMLFMIPLSWLGEYIFSIQLGMYTYRKHNIPAYVPFGHAMVFGIGWLLSEYSYKIKNQKIIIKTILYFFIVSFLFVILFLKDYFSLFFGIFFLEG